MFPLLDIHGDRVMRHMDNETHGQWGTWEVGHMGSRAHEHKGQGDGHMGDRAKGQWTHG